MSWDAYITSLEGSGKVSEAAILGTDGSTWAKSASLQLAAAEIQTIQTAFKDAGAAQANGIRLAGVKYLVIKADDTQVLGKKGATGVVIIKTGKAYILGTYKEGIQPGNCNTTVGKTADYLKEQGF